MIFNTGISTWPGRGAISGRVSALYLLQRAVR